MNKSENNIKSNISANAAVHIMIARTPHRRNIYLFQLGGHLASALPV